MLKKTTAKIIKIFLTVFLRPETKNETLYKLLMSFCLFPVSSTFLQDLANQELNHIPREFPRVIKHFTVWEFDLQILYLVCKEMNF